MNLTRQFPIKGLLSRALRFGKLNYYFLAPNNQTANNKKEKEKIGVAQVIKILRETTC